MSEKILIFGVTNKLGIEIAKKFYDKKNILILTGSNNTSISKAEKILPKISDN